MKQYTAQVGPDNASRLEYNGVDGSAVIEDIGEGTVRINDLDQLRSRGSNDDGAITDDEDGLQIWIDGESYPVFDDLDAAVANALGVLSQYDEAKREFDRQTALRASAVAKVIELAGGAPAAAKLLEVDESTITGASGPEPAAPAAPQPTTSETAAPQAHTPQAVAPQPDSA
jgi:hypothetical protein